MPKDYYRALGLPQGSPLTDIRNAFRNLAALYHPDKFSSASAEERATATRRMMELNEAMSVLGNVQKRSLYDRELKADAASPRNRARPVRTSPSPPASASTAPSASPVLPAALKSPSMEKRVAVLRQRLLSVPVPWISVDSSPWAWCLESNEKRRSLLIAHRHFDLLEQKDIRALDKAVDRLLSSWVVILLSCRRMTDATKVLPAIDDVARQERGWRKKRPMIIFYDEKSGRAMKFGETPAHKQMDRILTVLLQP